MSKRKRGALVISGRDKRALAVLAVAGVLALTVYFWPASNGVATVAGPDTVQAAEKRLSRARDLAAGVPEREDLLKKAKAELAEREKGLIQADTAPQAQAQLLQILRRVARGQVPPIEIRNTDIGQVKPYGQEYGEATIAAQFDCRIDQLVNLLADLTKQPELIATSDLRISSSNEKQKMLTVRLAVSGLVPKRLAPGKKGFGAF